jgi:RND family efflux transporter MFP subunit
MTNPDLARNPSNAEASLGAPQNLALSEARLHANRENAQHSTGPRTAEGKKRSSLRRLKKRCQSSAEQTNPSSAGSRVSASSGFAVAMRYSSWSCCCSRARPGLVAQQELDDARSKDLVSEAQVSAAQSAYVAAQQASAVNRAEQSRFRTLYHYTLVTAPFDGVVTKRYANTGSMIQAGTASQTQAMPIVRLSQNNLLRLMLPVPESDVPRIHLGQQVDVRVPALNRSFAGKVSRFTDKVTTSTRTMETEVDVPNPGLVLVPGMYAEVDLQLEERSHVLSIPVTAVDLTSSAPAVYRVSEDGSVSIVPVRLGMETSDRVEVTNGLNDGDMVIVGNRSGMKAGDKVRPKMVEIVEAKANS